MIDTLISDYKEQQEEAIEEEPQAEEQTEPLSNDEEQTSDRGDSPDGNNNN